VLALRVGTDVELPGTDCFGEPLRSAVDEAAIEMAVVDRAVGRVLASKFRLGLFEQPYVDEDAAPGILSDPESREVSRRAAEKTFVLLKNDPAGSGQAPLLPLSGKKKIAVIGPLADSPRDVLGAWVFDHDIEEAVTILAGIRERAGEEVEVEYAPGVLPGARLFPSMFDRMDHGLTAWAKNIDEEAELALAVELATAAEVAIVVVGQSQNMIGEFASSATLDLPGRQLELLQAVVATGTPTVALVMSGRPLDLRWAAEHVPAILQVWYPGTKAGEAVAATLFGDVVPGGRLPFTWPRTVGQVPIIYNHYRTFQPENQDKRYWEEESTPLWEFGHGLSYASFTYSAVRIAPTAIRIGEAATVSVDVTNTSDIEADEVVQFYLHQRHGTSSRPIRELKGFRRVTLGAGETITVNFELGPDQLRYWSAVTHDWVQDATDIDVWVGGTSAVTEPDASTALEVRS
jgi:beta-glucosidase